MRRIFGLVFAVSLLAPVAQAEDAKPPPSPAPAAAPSPPTAPAPATEAPPANQAPAPTQSTSAPGTQAPATLSHSKFLAPLYAEIAKQSETTTGAGLGEVSATFHVDAKGKIDKVVIGKSSSLRHAALVKKILTAVQAPPPPGGGMDVTQSFKFH